MVVVEQNNRNVVVVEEENNRNVYLPAFLDTGLPRGIVHERDSGLMQGAIPTQSHNP